MSKLLLGEKSGKIQDVHFAYTRIQTPVKKYQSQDTEFSVDVVVDKATAKEMKKNFPKNGVREVENEDFENVYKFPPPYPEQEEQYVLKFKTNSHNQDGQEKPYEWSIRPKVYVPVEGGIKDVTRETRVGNGSSGDLAFNFSDSKFGVVHHLSGILVKNMIELQSKNVTPFGEVVESVESNVSEELDEIPF